MKWTVEYFITRNTESRGEERDNMKRRHYPHTNTHTQILEGEKVL